MIFMILCILSSYVVHNLWYYLLNFIFSLHMHDQIVSEYVADHLWVNFCMLIAIHSWKDGFITSKCPGLVIKLPKQGLKVRNKFPLNSVTDLVVTLKVFQFSKQRDLNIKLFNTQILFHVTAKGCYVYLQRLNLRYSGIKTFPVQIIF